MADEVKKDPGWYKEEWWFKIITARPFVNYAKDLINKDNPASTHNFVSLVWGFGSFLFYWIDHFAFHRKSGFTNNEFWFIAGMAGVTTITAVANNLATKKGDS